MGLYDRDYMRASHPYSCLCNQCCPPKKKKKAVKKSSGTKFYSSGEEINAEEVDQNQRRRKKEKSAQRDSEADTANKPKGKPKTKRKTPADASRVIPQKKRKTTPSSARGKFTTKWHESTLVAFFSPARWLLVILGVGLFYLAMWHHAEMVEQCPLAGKEIMGVIRIEVIIFGVILFLIGLFAGDNEDRIAFVFKLCLFVAIGSGARHGYLYLERTGKINQWIESGEKFMESGRNTVRTAWHRKRLNFVGANGKHIFLDNNPDAKDPSWAELKHFLKEDDTDLIPYSYSSFVCADYAHRLHDNAEKAGWRCYFVSVELGPSPDRPTSGGHALNAFKTTDYGFVFIDCTRPLRSGYLGSADKEMKVVKGRDYVPKTIFPSDGSTWLPMGEVLEIDLY